MTVRLDHTVSAAPDNVPWQEFQRICRANRHAPCLRPDPPGGSPVVLSSRSNREDVGSSLPPVRSLLYRDTGYSAAAWLAKQHHPPR